MMYARVELAAEVQQNDRAVRRLHLEAHDEGCLVSAHKRVDGQVTDNKVLVWCTRCSCALTGHSDESHSDGALCDE